MMIIIIMEFDKIPMLLFYFTVLTCNIQYFERNITLNISTANEKYYRK